MIRALLLAYYFPPIGGAGSQRWVKLARYLPDSAVGLTVVTGPGSTAGRWSPLDATLSAELPAETEIRRIGSAEPPPSSGRAARAERWLRRESAWSRWWVAGTVETAISGQHVPDVIVASMSPYASAEAAASVSRALGRPWIADLRDPWALDEMTIQPTRLHRRLEIARMRRLLGSSSAIVTTTAEAVRLIRAHVPEVGARPVVSIPNGFDEHDFAGEQPLRTDGAFRIVHTGYLHTDLGEGSRTASIARRLLGGGVRGVEILTRSHVFLLEAIERVVAASGPDDPPVELHLAGVLSESDRRLADRYPFVRVHGYLEHADAVALMRSGDLLFLPMQKMPPGLRSSIVPGKTYEYLAARRPILAAVPEGDARDIVEESGMARICEPDDVAGIAAAIEAERDGVRQGSGPAPVEDALGRFERRALAARYAELLGEVAVR